MACAYAGQFWENAAAKSYWRSTESMSTPSAPGVPRTSTTISPSRIRVARYPIHATRPPLVANARGPAQVARLRHINIVRDARIVGNDVEKPASPLQRADHLRAPVVPGCGPTAPSVRYGGGAGAQALGRTSRRTSTRSSCKAVPVRALRDGNFLDSGTIRMAGQGFRPRGRMPASRKLPSRRARPHGLARRSRAGAARCPAQGLALRRRREPDTGASGPHLERRRTQMVGTLQRGRRFLYVIPDDPRIPHDTVMCRSARPGPAARIGDKVVVRVREWKSPTRIRKARSSKFSGTPGGKAWTCFRCCANTICRCIFPKLSLHEAHAIDDGPRARRGWPRGLPRHRVVTIDPTTQKISTMPFVWSAFRRSNGGCGFTLWTCSHYVKPGTAPGRGGAQTRPLDLSRGPRHPDAAGGVEQRTGARSCRMWIADQVRRISRVE